MRINKQRHCRRADPSHRRRQHIQTHNQLMLTSRGFRRYRPVERGVRRIIDRTQCANTIKELQLTHRAHALRQQHAEMFARLQLRLLIETANDGVEHEHAAPANV